jgi:hypothetical protein
MKKLFILLFVLGVSLPSFAGLKEKNVIGTWSYKVETDQETLTGTMKFVKEDGKLTGEIFSDEGESLTMNNVETKDKNVLYFEIAPDYNVLKVSLTIDGKKYEGTVDVNDMPVPITGEKVE